MARFVVPAVRDDDRSWTEVGARRATRALSFWGTTSATAMIAGNQQAISTDLSRRATLLSAEGVLTDCGKHLGSGTRQP